jgi:hypothetical protein
MCLRRDQAEVGELGVRFDPRQVSAGYVVVDSEDPSLERRSLLERSGRRK